MKINITKFKLSKLGLAVGIASGLLSLLEFLTKAPALPYWLAVFGSLMGFLVYFGNKGKADDPSNSI